MHALIRCIFSKSQSPTFLVFVFDVIWVFVCLFAFFYAVECYVCVCGLVLFIFLSLIHPSLLINWIGTEWPAILNGKLALPISQWIDKLITKVSYIYWITINTHTHTHSFAKSLPTFVRRGETHSKYTEKLFKAFSHIFETLFHRTDTQTHHFPFELHFPISTEPLKRNCS